MEQKQSRIIIAFLILLFVLGTLILFYVSNKNLDLDYKKNWWVVYFTQADSDSLSFAIENHSKATYFRWEALSGKEKIAEGFENIMQGQFQIVIEPESVKKEKGTLVTIKVYSEDEMKEIYKNF